jgi:hypothetical protein
MYHKLLSLEYQFCGASPFLSVMTCNTESITFRFLFAIASKHDVLVDGGNHWAEQNC